MTGINKQAREDALFRTLLRQGPTPAKELLTALDISQATFSRLLTRMKGRVQALGRGKSTIYIGLREVRNLGSRIPLYQVNTEGKCAALGDLLAFHPRGYALSESNNPAHALYPGIPFFLSDARPQGFLGRQFPRCHPDLRLPDRLVDWSEDDFMEAIARRSEDCPGNLIVGHESFERYHASILKHAIPPIRVAEKAKSYAAAANAALDGLVPGSSAAGEQPKFTAVVDEPNGARHVLVKFSPPVTGPAGRRWADLLVCESLALSVLAEAGVASSETRILEYGERTFLEVTRFDRVGRHGRIGVISLAALDDEWFGRRDDWVSASTRSLERDAINADDAGKIRLLYSFGGLIANSDRHFGNISMFWNIGTDQARLAPAYDMLPMLYAPVEGRIVDRDSGRAFGREFAIEPPKSAALEEWRRALPLARLFWDRVSLDERISNEFRKTASQNRDLLDHRAAYL